MEMVKSVLGWNTGGPPRCISVGGRLISKPIEIATEMNCYFINKIKSIVKNLPRSQYDPSILTQKIMRNMNNVKYWFKTKFSHQKMSDYLGPIYQTTLVGMPI